MNMARRTIITLFAFLLLAASLYVVYANGIPALNAALDSSYSPETIRLTSPPPASGPTAGSGDASAVAALATDTPGSRPSAPGVPTQQPPNRVIGIATRTPDSRVFVNDGCVAADYPPISSTLLRDFDAANNAYSFAENARIDMRATGSLNLGPSAIRLIMNGEINTRETGEFSMAIEGTGDNNGVRNQFSYDTRLVSDLVYMRADITTGVDTGWLATSFDQYLTTGIADAGVDSIPAEFADEIYAQFADLGFDNYRYTTLQSTAPGGFVTTTCVDVFGFALSRPVNDLLSLAANELVIADPMTGQPIGSTFAEVMLYLRAIVPSLKLEFEHTIQDGRVTQLVMSMDGQISSLLVGAASTPTFNLRVQFDITYGVTEAITAPTDYELVPEIFSALSAELGATGALQTITITATPAP